MSALGIFARRAIRAYRDWRAQEAALEAARDLCRERAGDRDADGGGRAVQRVGVHAAGYRDGVAR